MPYSLGADTKKVRNHNRTIVLNMVREKGPVSKATIARNSGISFSTVNRVVDELLKENLVETAQDQLERGGGRPGELFVFSGKSHFVIGVDLGYPNLRGMIADLAGEIHKEIVIPIEIGNGTENYQRLLSLLAQLKQETDGQIPQISGVGLGVAGIVDHAHGVVIQSTIMGWDNFPLAKRLYKDTGLTSFIDSDINLITFGEYGFGIGQGISNMACITLGTRVLCGLVIHDEIFRSSNFNNGRLDQFLPTAPGISIPTSLYGGTLDTIISSTSVLKSARQRLEKIDPATAATLDDARLVYRAFEKGQPWAMETIEPIIPILSTAIANISALIDPEIVVIVGRMAEESRLIIPAISNYLTGKISHVPHLAASPLGTRATVLGAVMLVYRGLLQNW